MRCGACTKAVGWEFFTLNECHSIFYSVSHWQLIPSPMIFNPKRMRLITHIFIYDDLIKMLAILLNEFACDNLEFIEYVVFKSWMNDARSERKNANKKSVKISDGINEISNIVTGDACSPQLYEFWCALKLWVHTRHTIFYIHFFVRVYRRDHCKNK